MPNLTEIVFRAHQIASGRGVDPHDSPVVDAGLTAEALYPHALRFVIRKALSEGSNSVQDFAASHDVEVVGGTASIPDSVLREYMDHAYLTNDPYAAFVKYPDFQRNRFNNLLCYFAFNAGSMHYSCDSPKEVRSVSVFVNGGDEDFTGGTGTNFTASDIGRRIQLYDGDNLIIDAFIASIAGSGAFSSRGQSLVSTAAGAGTIFESDRYVVSRSLTAITTVTGDETVDCPGGAFTDADIGRRLTVLVGGTYIVDAIIASINSPTSVELTAKALSSTAVGVGDVMFSSVSLTAPSVPAEPVDADTDIDISPNLIEDIITVIAAALTGEMKLETLIKKESFGKR